jgi:hypothetical protein
MSFIELVLSTAPRIIPMGCSPVRFGMNCARQPAEREDRFADFNYSRAE